MTSPSLRDYAELVLLSAIWGSSFLFLRVSAPILGPAFLIEMRVLSALLVLLPICIFMGKHREALANWKLIFLVSLTNMSIPFCLLAYASMSIGAGVTSVLNSTVPFFAAIIAFVFWSQRMTLTSILGLILGFSGVVVLVLGPSSESSLASDGKAISAGIAAAMFYGTAVNITANKLQGISGLSITVGSLFCASLCLAPFAVYSVPEEMPSQSIWLSVIALGVLCTGVAYLMFYRLIAKVGPHRAITSTFMIPLFSIVWGAIFLGETITIYMIAGCVLVLFGVAMTTGFISRFNAS
jgi:drug/metabolite transporter (DMT)-like permease|tara:strand:- start:1459 stop:2346 length:888 start_codon:yes stop_codon:yes gene_type:complete